MKTILMTPGPVVLSERVRDAMLQPDLCHREQEFTDLQNRIRANLLDVYGLDNNDWASILLTGSGTSAMEAMMTSFVPSYGKVLIIENGIYGERLSRIAQIHNVDHIVLHHAWGEEIDLKKLEDQLDRHDQLSHIAIVHHETTSGRLNDIDAIAAICKKHGNISILLDAVSSFGAEDIRFCEWNLAACAATANKCLHAAPGVSFVIGNRNAIKMMSATPARTLYLDLATYLKDQDANSTPFTQSIQTFYALSEALDELQEQGGLQKRRQTYWQRMIMIREVLIDLGIKPYLARKHCSCVLNSFYLPAGIPYQQLHDHLKQAGFVIYAGQGDLARLLFRISCMGEITNADMQRFAKAMISIVKR